MKTNEGQRIGLIEILVTIILLLLLISGIVSLNNENKSAINSLSFDMQQQNFQQNAALMKSQWLLEGRPQEIQFSFFNQNQDVSNQVSFMMSELGWPMLQDKGSQTYCQDTLANITNMPFNDEQKLVFKITKVQKDDDITCHFCDAGNNDKCFRYSIR